MIKHKVVKREKLMNSIENMSTVKIAQISANQRKRVADKLFHVENVSVFKNKKVLFFDDAYKSCYCLNRILCYMIENHLPLY